MTDQPKLSFEDIIGGAELDELRNIGTADEGDRNIICGRDVYGNEFAMAYVESECETHGAEASLILAMLHEDQPQEDR